MMKKKLCKLCRGDMQFHKDLILCERCDTQVITQMEARRA